MQPLISHLLKYLYTTNAMREDVMKTAFREAVYAAQSFMVPQRKSTIDTRFRSLAHGFCELCRFSVLQIQTLCPLYTGYYKGHSIWKDVGLVDVGRNGKFRHG